VGVHVVNVVGHVLKICCGCVGDSLWMVCCVVDGLGMLWGVLDMV